MKPVKESFNAYLPRDRLNALAENRDLPAEAVGSVLFADISGFTPLTEAYEAHLGARRGGEELAQVLNAVYAGLIGEVDRMRGSVIGFAGDAITCWFDGDDGLRAVAAALAMQHAMEAFAAIPAPGAGSFALRLKAAVATGEVRRFAVGAPSLQRVDVLAGQPVYTVAELEQTASPGEVVIGADTRARLVGRVQTGAPRSGENSAPETWVVDDLTAQPMVEPWPEMEALATVRGKVESWILPSIRLRLGSGLGEFLTELRPATALFVKFEGIEFETDGRSGEKLGEFFSAAQRIIEAHGGILHQLTVGDKGSFFYGAFGAPVSHEDDTHRALAAALRLREMAAPLGFLRALRMGLGRGTCRAGAYGGPTRRSYGVLGDQVNLAARLMGKAAPDQILVSATVAREGAQRFNLHPLPAVRVKGKSDPVDVWALEGELRESDRFALDDGSPLIGRAAERARLGEVLERAKSGYGQTVLLLGDAGMGKSRLAAEGTRQAHQLGFRTLHGECPTFGANPLYTPWRTVWRSLFGLRGDETPEAAANHLHAFLESIDQRLVDRLPLLGAVLNLSLPDNALTATFDAKLRRASLDALLIDCLRAEATHQPLLLVLDDAHALDAVSGELLRTVIQAIARIPVLLFVVGRPDTLAALSEAESTLEYFHTLHLSEFSAEEAAELVRHKFSRLSGGTAAISGDAIARLTARTGGNPFFIEEVMDWMHQQGLDLSGKEALDGTDLPVSLQALVLSRMDQLAEDARASLKVASVVGRRFLAGLVWGGYPELGGEAPVRAALEELMRRDFTERTQDTRELTYFFKRVVIQEVAYESLPHQLRSRLHEAIGGQIEASGPAETLDVLSVLAFHYGRGADKEKKRRYLLLAGDAARHAYANAAAAVYYEAALPLVSKHARIPVLENLARVREMNGDWPQAMEHRREALRFAESHELPREAAHCRLEIGDLLRKTGAFDEARRALDEARAALEELRDEAGLAQALHSAGTLAAQGGDYTQAKLLYGKSLEIRRRLGDDAKAASLLSNLGIIERFEGHLDRALAMQEESLTLRRSLNDPWAVGNSLNNLGVAKRYRGDLSGARVHLEEALHALQKVGDRAEIANTLNSLAEVALDQKDATACEDFLLESLRLTRELGNLRALAFLFEAFAANALLRQRPQRCLRLIGVADALRTRMGAPLPEADRKRLDDLITRATAALDPVKAKQILAEGATLPLSQALDSVTGEFAASLTQQTGLDS